MANSSLHLARRRRQLALWLAVPCAWTARPARAGAAAAQASAPSTGTSNAWLELWVVLTVPDLASLPREMTAERAALRERILAQQDQVMASLQALGAVELARVQTLRNAMAIRLRASQLPAARALPGVMSIHVVRNLDRAPPLPPSD